MSDIFIGASVGLIVSVGMWAPYIIITDYKRKKWLKHNRY